MLGYILFSLFDSPRLFKAS